MEREIFCSLEEHKKPLGGFIEAIDSAGSDTADTSS